MKKNKSILLSTPYLVWMVVFTLIPLGVVCYYALTDPSTGEFSLVNLRGLNLYWGVLWQSIFYAVASAFICLLLGYPTAYYIAHRSQTAQKFLYMLVMLPMCMSFLLRTLAWVGLLQDTGIINNILDAIGIGRLRLIRTPGAVILGMVYNYLPYMILPLYGVIVKIDSRLIEAAEDLGCNSTQVFSRVVLPLSVPGILSGMTMVFVPAVSTFYISQKLGGTDTVLVGDVIERQFKQGNNPNLGASLSLVLMILVFICTGIMNRFGGDWTNATIVNSDFKYYRSTDWGSISKEDAIARADEVMRELGLGDMVLADAQTPREGERKGTWELYYTPSVNGLPIPGIREDRVFSDPAIGEDHQYWTYRCSEETNADTVSWYMESVWITVGRDGILSFEWDAPSTEPVIKETQTALMPFEDIASIANTMLPVVVGPSEARSLVEIDKINGDETYMDVEITKVSLSLMRIRDKGSLQGTIVPVWDFWGTWDWYEPGDNASESMKKGANYVTQPMLTLNAIDGNVVSRMFGY